MFAKTVFVTDNIELADGALEYIATLFDDTQIHLLSIVDTSRRVKDQLEDIYRDVESDRTIDILAHAYRKLKAMGIEAETVMLKGNPVREVLKYVKKESVDLLVLETYDRLGQHLSHAEPIITKLVKRAKCSLFILNSPTDLPEPKRILWVLEGSRTYKADEPVAAIAMAKAFDGAITLLHVAPDEHARGKSKDEIAAIDAVFGTWCETAELNYELTTEVGPVAPTITKHASEHDIVILDRLGDGAINLRMLTKELIPNSTVPIALDKL